MDRASSTDRANTTDQENMSQGKLLAILGGILLLALLVLGTVIAFKASAKPVPKALEHFAAEACKGLPKMIDKETRLDSIKAGPGIRLSHFYTLIHREQGYANQANDEETLRKRLVENYQKSEKMKRFRESKIEMRHVYRDKNGKQLFEVVLTPQ